MALEYTEEKLNSLDKETIIQLFLSQQEQLKQIDHNLQLVLEQVGTVSAVHLKSTNLMNRSPLWKWTERLYFLTNPKPWPTKRPVKPQRPYPVGNRKRNRESGKKIWKDCRSWWSNIP